MNRDSLLIVKLKTNMLTTLFTQHLRQTNKTPENQFSSQMNEEKKALT